MRLSGVHTIARASPPLEIDKKFYTFDKYILLLGQILFTIWTNTFYKEKYILHFQKMRFIVTPTTTSHTAPGRASPIRDRQTTRSANPLLQLHL